MEGDWLCTERESKYSTYHDSGGLSVYIVNVSSCTVLWNLGVGGGGGRLAVHRERE